MQKRGQVTVFIIIAILLVSILAAFILFRQGLIPGIATTQEQDPNSYLQLCLEDKIKEITEILYLNGGYLEPPFYKEYDGKTITYLCYNQNNYLSCINQQPMLLKHLKKEIRDYISADVEACYTSLLESLDKQGYSLKSSYEGFNVSLAPKKIIVDIFGEISMTKSDVTTTKKDFKVVKLSRFYDLAIVVQEIVSQEAEYCYFNTLGYMMVDSSKRIVKQELNDGAIVYSVKDRKTEEEFWFAVRSCFLPGGV